MKRRALWTTLAAAGLLGDPGVASAHELRACLLDIKGVGAGHYIVYWAAKAPSDGSEAPFPVFPPHCRAAEGEGGSPPRALDCGGDGLAGSSITIEGLARSRVDVVVRYSEAGGEVTSQVLRADAPTFTAPRETSGSRSKIKLAGEYLRAGFDHILLGWDHLLFVLGLLLLVKEVRALVWTITAFTLAHSVTLALATTGLVRVPQAPAEALIALSLTLLAAEIARPAREGPLARRRPWFMAFAFGLLHGFGFAGALTDLGLPRGEIPLALFAFNAGVECGQLAFVIAVLGLAALVRRSTPDKLLEGSRRRLAELAIAYGIGALSTFWLLERLARLGS